MNPRRLLTALPFLTFTVQLLLSAPVAGAEFDRGDCNSDGRIEISDSIFLFGCLFLGTRCSRCQDACDANDDGKNDVSDGIYLLSYLFLGGRPPLEPSGKCGPDPTLDRLDCEEASPRCSEPEPNTDGAPESPSAPPLGIRVELLETFTTTPRGLTSLKFLIANNGGEMMSAQPWLVCTGLDGRTARHPLPATRIPGHGEIVSSFPLSSLPLQSVGSTSEALVMVQVSGEDGPVSIPSQPFSYDFMDDYSKAFVYNAEGAFERFGRQGDAELLELAGRVQTATGGYADIRQLQKSENYPIQFGSTRPKLGYALADDTPIQIFKSGFKIRGMWWAHFVDAGFGEDFLVPPPNQDLQRVPASFAHAEVVKHSNDSTVWKGKLDAQGYTPVLPLTPGGYTLMMSTILETPQGQKFTVMLRTYNPDLDPQMSITLDTGMVVLPNPPPGVHTQDLAPPYEGPISNACAVVSHILSRPDHGIVPGDYTIYSDTGCPGGLSTDSCVSGGIVYIGTDAGGGLNDGEWKYIIAHEIGHRIQAEATGGFSYGYSLDGSPDACRCDHVTVANSLHCLQSLEKIGAAHLEGFAQFFAAKAFNDLSQNNCTFVYYKEFLFPGGANVAAPPHPVDCRFPVQWRNNYCIHMEETGTEYDWMGFLYNLNRVITMDDIHQLYVMAKVSDYNILYEDLRQAAEDYYGSSSSAYSDFVTLANQYGVDDEF